MRLLQKGCWGSGDSVRDDDPACITKFTQYMGIGGCCASLCSVAWPSDSCDNCDQCKPGNRWCMSNQAVACLHSSDSLENWASAS